MNDDRAARQAIIDACWQMNAAGINQGTSGNISVRAAGGLLITPSAVACERLAPEQIVRLDAAGAPHGVATPSSEWRMHRAIYGRFPAAGAVVHAHPTFCTALACHDRAIPAFHYMIAVAGGADIRCAAYATFGTRALSDQMLIALADRKACLLSHHGMICHEATLERALWLAVEVETLARQYWHACQLGEPASLPAEEIDRVRQRFYRMKSDR